ncbi:MAG: hypothetical protein P8Y00_02595, partial [Deltaproteobacteria bacterium]
QKVIPTSISLPPESADLLQKESNVLWSTNVKPVCEISGKKSNLVVELKIGEEDGETRACFPPESDCMRQARNSGSKEIPGQAIGR